MSVFQLYHPLMTGMYTSQSHLVCYKERTSIDKYIHISSGGTLLYYFHLFFFARNTVKCAYIEFKTIMVSRVKIL